MPSQEIVNNMHSSSVCPTEEEQSLRAEKNMASFMAKEINMLIAMATYLEQDKLSTSLSVARDDLRTTFDL